MTDTRQRFNSAFKRFEKSVAAVPRKIMLEMDSQIVSGTPVDTGAAKGGWIPSLGAASQVVSENLDKTGEQTIANAQEMHAQSDGYQVMFLSNRLPYIERLENGHSKLQAPNGWVKLAIQRVASIFK